MTIELHYFEAPPHLRLHVAVVSTLDPATLTWLLGPLYPTGRTLRLEPGRAIPGINAHSVRLDLVDRGWAVLGSGFH